jgi:C1A family cysteine protease
MKTPFELENKITESQMKQIKKRLGWVKDRPDHRDYIFPTLPKASAAKVDLRANDQPIYDQGDLGSCTANAIAAAYAFDLKKQSKPVFAPSRLFIYYNERVLENSVPYDAGAYIRDGIKSINVSGVCQETMWPYIQTKFASLPPKTCYTEAAKHKSVLYQRVTQTLDQMKAVLNSGLPFTVGFYVYYSFLAAGTNGGIVPMPSRYDQLLGGHAVLVVGYDDSTQRFIMRNSWGTSWGDKGYFYMPYAYLTNPTLSNDFWVVQTVTG